MNELPLESLSIEREHGEMTIRLHLAGREYAMRLSYAEFELLRHRKGEVIKQITIKNQ